MATVRSEKFGEPKIRGDATQLSPFSLLLQSVLDHLLHLLIHTASERTSHPSHACARCSRPRRHRRTRSPNQ